jgi:hypothetical protein
MGCSGGFRHDGEDALNCIWWVMVVRSFQVRLGLFRMAPWITADLFTI